MSCFFNDLDVCIGGRRESAGPLPPEREGGDEWGCVGCDGWLGSNWPGGRSRLGIEGAVAGCDGRSAR